MKNVKRLLALASALLMVVTLALMTSCDKKIPVQVNEPFTFPYHTRVNLTWWNAYDDTYFDTENFTAIEDHPYMKRMVEETNVYVEYVIPTADSLHGMRDELQGMMAAGACPDMVSHMFHDIYTDGYTLDAVIDEEIYLQLNEFIDVQMPNFTALMNQYSIIDKVIRTPQDNIVYIPNLVGVDSYETPVMTSGIVIRKDFLDTLQLDVPVTFADWDEVLRGFQSMGIDTPFSTGSMPYAASIGDELFLSAYGQAYEWYIDKETGKVAHGNTTDGMKGYVTQLNKWVSEGLMIVGDVNQDQKITDEVGAWAGNATEIMQLKGMATNENYEIVACPDPVLNEGDKITCRANYRPIGVHTIGNIHLAFDCSQPAIAAKWIDQMFSEEKYLEASYGIKGEDYNLDAEGNVVFTEKITGFKNGIRYGIAQNAFLESFWRDGNVMINYGYTPEAKAACEIWSLSTREHSMVNSDVLALTEEEAAVVDGLTGAGQFFFAQFDIKNFITGSKPLDEWDAYVANMNEMGLDELIETYQIAYDRYLAG